MTNAELPREPLPVSAAADAPDGNAVPPQIVDELERAGDDACAAAGGDIVPEYLKLLVGYRVQRRVPRRVGRRPIRQVDGGGAEGWDAEPHRARGERRNHLVAPDGGQVRPQAVVLLAKELRVVPNVRQIGLVSKSIGGFCELKRKAVTRVGLLPKVRYTIGDGNEVRRSSGGTCCCAVCRLLTANAQARAADGERRGTANTCGGSGGEGGRVAARAARPARHRAKGRGREANVNKAVIRNQCEAARIAAKSCPASGRHHRRRRSRCRSCLPRPTQLTLARRHLRLAKILEPAAPKNGRLRSAVLEQQGIDDLLPRPKVVLLHVVDNRVEVDNNGVKVKGANILGELDRHGLSLYQVDIC